MAALTVATDHAGDAGWGVRLRPALWAARRRPDRRRHPDGPGRAVLAAAGPSRPAAAEVWSGWVGVAQKTGFGLVRPLPGIWPALRLDTAITLPIGVEAYAVYALRAWLARGRTISARTRRFAKWPKYRRGNAR